MTVRREIITMLESKPYTAKDIGNELGLVEKDVVDHLEHIARSVARTKKLRIIPAQCRTCGFTFSKRSRFSAPSKCPQCRSQRIDGPEFQIL